MIRNKNFEYCVQFWSPYAQNNTLQLKNVDDSGGAGFAPGGEQLSRLGLFCSGGRTVQGHMREVCKVTRQGASAGTLSSTAQSLQKEGALAHIVERKYGKVFSKGYGWKMIVKAQDRTWPKSCKTDWISFLNR